MELGPTFNFSCGPIVAENTGVSRSPDHFFLSLCDITIVGFQRVAGVRLLFRPCELQGGSTSGHGKRSEGAGFKHVNSFGRGSFPSEGRETPEMQLSQTSR